MQTFTPTHIHLCLYTCTHAHTHSYSVAWIQNLRYREASRNITNRAKGKGQLRLKDRCLIEARKRSRSLSLSSGLATVSTITMSFTEENFSVALNSIQATWKKSFSFLWFFVCTYSILTGHSNESLRCSFLFAASVLVPEWPKIIRTESCFVWVYEKQTNSTLFLWWLLVNRRINKVLWEHRRKSDHSVYERK